MEMRSAMGSVRRKMVKTKKGGLILVIAILPLLLSACSHIAFPRGPIPVKMEVVGPMDPGKEVSFVNGVADSKLTLVAAQGSDKWFADYRQWTGFIISQLETELRNRGVQIKAESKDAMKVAVENVGLFWGSFSQRCIVRVRVEKSDGSWSKTYEGNNASGNLPRAMDGAVYKIVVAIMGDQDFKNAMR